jgi:hypothetical protein
MMPDTQALQVFYGTLPLIFVIFGAFLRSQMLLKDILARLGRLEAAVDAVKTEIGLIKERLIALETRAGIVFRP